MEKIKLPSWIYADNGALCVDTSNPEWQKGFIELVERCRKFDVVHKRKVKESLTETTPKAEGITDQELSNIELILQENKRLKERLKAADEVIELTQARDYQSDEWDEALSKYNALKEKT